MSAKYPYPNGSEYVGEWDKKGQRSGLGHLAFPDNSEYFGQFHDGLTTGLGAMLFADGSRYVMAYRSTLLFDLM